jgi:glycosyltransferase involved in cell wall biosynthesis
MEIQKNDVIIIIPVRNVEGMITETLRLVNESDINRTSKILIIDNKSEDRSVDEIKNFVKESSSKLDLEIKVNEQNLGYGGSVKKGLEIAISNKFNWVVIVHGDNQTDWKSILNKFTHLINENNHDVISTTRFSPDSNISRYSKIRILGNKFFIIMTKVCTNLKISDPGVAIMAFKTSLIENFDLETIHDGYMFHPQLNIIIFGSHNRCIEVPMHWQDAKHREPFNLFSYGINLSKFLLKYGFYFKVLKFDSREALFRLSQK